jgi:hypothetical protein
MINADKNGVNQQIKKVTLSFINFVYFVVKKSVLFICVRVSRANGGEFRERC